MGKRFYLNLAERVLWTFVQAFAATLVVAGTVDTDGAKTAVVAAAFAVLKVLASRGIGDPEDGAILSGE